MIQSWTEVCDRLLCGITPLIFRLSICCRVSDEDSAVRIIEPLKRLQPIADAAIWLDSDPSKKSLTRIAKMAVRELVGSNKDIQASPHSRSFWNDLPREIHLAILSLVVRDPPSDLDPPLERDGFEVFAGKLEQRASVCCLNCNFTRSICNCSSTAAASSTTCTCSTVPVDLFLVSKLMYADSKEILFSCNCFVLNGDFKANQRWLFSLTPTELTTTELGYLRMIDLEISWEQLYEMGKPQSRTAADWVDPAARLASLLSPGTTWLSIDTSNTWDYVMTMNPERVHALAWLHTSYARIFDPLYQHFTRREPRKLHVFLSCSFKYESMAETRLMGSNYNSVAEGKIPWERRHPMFPHNEQKKASRQNRTRPHPN